MEKGTVLTAEQRELRRVAQAKNSKIEKTVKTIEALKVSMAAKVELIGMVATDKQSVVQAQIDALQTDLHTQLKLYKTLTGSDYGTETARGKEELIVSITSGTPIATIDELAENEDFQKYAAAMEDKPYYLAVLNGAVHIVPMSRLGTMNVPSKDKDGNVLRDKDNKVIYSETDVPVMSPLKTYYADASGTRVEQPAEETLEQAV